MRKTPGLVIVVMLAVLGLSRGASAQFYAQHNLVSDGSVPAALVDANLVNAWGLAASATSPWWVADNGTDVEHLYNGNTGAKVALVVQVAGAPTGVVLNSGAGFLVDGTVARFIFSAEDGTIRAWNRRSARSPPRRSLPARRHLQGPRDREHRGRHRGSTPPTSTTAGRGVRRRRWTPVPGGFVDPGPSGRLCAVRHPEPQRHGSTSPTRSRTTTRKTRLPGRATASSTRTISPATSSQRVASGDVLERPVGIALAPDDFGKFSNDLLIGNFGDGKIHAFSPDKSRRQRRVPEGRSAARDRRGAARHRRAVGDRSSATAPRQRTEDDAVLHGGAGRGDRRTCSGLWSWRIRGSHNRLRAGRL